MDWQPIETAPRDGSDIDLWVVPPEPNEPYRLTDSYWHPGDSGFWHGVNPDETATHWMPQPDPPS